MSREQHDKDQIKKLIEGDLGWNEIQQEVMPDPKDDDRFRKVREVLQETVEWDEEILVPLNDHLFLVTNGDERIVKAECGHEFCGEGESWRENAGVRVIDDEDEWAKWNSKWQSADPEWGFQVRQFICPECAEIISTEAVPVGYPVFRKFEPDVDTFYEEWLDEPVPEGT